MEDQNNYVTQEQLDEARKEIIEDVVKGLGTIFDNVLTQIKLLEKTQISTEQQVALLVMAYAEQTVAIEALVAQIVFRSEEEQAAFNTKLNENKRQMLKVMQEGVKSGGTVAETDPRIAAALEALVNEQLDQLAD